MTSCFENFEYVYRPRKKKLGSTFSLFALIHSLKRKFKINNESHSLIKSVEYICSPDDRYFIALSKVP